MRKFLSNRKALAAVAVLCSASAFAEGAASTVSANTVSQYITDGVTAMNALFTAGAAIVGGFFIWRLIKKALNASK